VRAARDDEFEAFVRGNRAWLVRFARTLTAGDAHLAEDLVSVSGHPGRIDDQDGVLILTYSDGTHNVEVQAWSNIHLSRDQLVQFAEGVTVLPSAQEGHG
jgi:hypothetical protein